MSTLLHISASPRGERSESLALAATFLQAFTETHPHVDVEHFDLWDGALPPFGPAAAAAKMAVFAGADPEGEAAAAWRAAQATFERYAAADHYLFSVPMWNHTVPYILKQLIDVISQPGMIFGFDPESGYTGLLQDKRAAVLYSGAVYGPGRGPGFGRDFLTPYFEDWLAWSGIDDVRTVHFQPNLAIADPEPGRRRAHREAAELGRTFLAPSSAGRLAG